MTAVTITATRALHVAVPGRYRHVAVRPVTTYRADAFDTVFENTNLSTLKSVIRAKAYRLDPTDKIQFTVQEQSPAEVAPPTPPVPAPVPSGAAGKAAGVESSGWSRSSSGGRHTRTPVPAVEVQATSSFLPPLADLRAAASVTPRAERAVWLMDDHGRLLFPMGQPVTDPLDVAERVAWAAVLVEQGHAVDLAVLDVGPGARHELLHVRALVECLDRTTHQPALPGRGPYAQVPR
jgi:hypothetical protein